MGTSQFIAKRHYRDRLLAAYERALEEAMHATKQVFQTIDTPHFGAANDRLVEARRVCNNIRWLALQVFANGAPCHTLPRERRQACNAGLRTQSAINPPDCRRKRLS